MKRADDCELELAETRLIEEKVMRLYAAVRRVNADRQIELARRIVEREEIGNTEPPVGFKPSQVDATGAVLFAERQFLGHSIQVEQRRNHHPAKTVRRFLYDVGHPTVVAATQGEVSLRPPRRWKDKNRRIDYLDVDAELVHVFDPDIEIAHVPGR